MKWQLKVLHWSCPQDTASLTNGRVWRYGVIFACAIAFIFGPTIVITSCRSLWWKITCETDLAVVNYWSTHGISVVNLIAFSRWLMKELYQLMIDSEVSTIFSARCSLKSNHIPDDICTTQYWGMWIQVASRTSNIALAIEFEIRRIPAYCAPDVNDAIWYWTFEFLALVINIVFLL